MTISQKINKYLFTNKNFEYVIFNFDYFTTDYKIPNNTKITERQEYGLYFEKILEKVKKRNIIDVGGNCGLFSIPLLKYGYNCTIFEPIKMNTNLIELNLKENNLTNYEIVNSALMDFEGKREIFIPYCSDNTSFNLNVAISNMNKKDYLVENVDCLIFDKWIEDKNTEFKDNIGLIKIDVQGSEKQCLLGMQKFLTESHNIYLLIEWDKTHTLQFGNTLEEISDLLNRCGFKIEVDLQGDVFFYKS
jgi:FkbM family methyltransferase